MPTLRNGACAWDNVPKMLREPSCRPHPREPNMTQQPNKYCESCARRLDPGEQTSKGICVHCEAQDKREAEDDFWDNENPYDYTADL